MLNRLVVISLLLICLGLSTAKETIKRHLLKGEKHAIKKSDLARICNLNEREMREVINELIEDGLPVCSRTGNPAGYFIAETPEELRASIETIDHYAMSLLKHEKLLRNCLDVMENECVVLDNGQRRMF